MKKLFFIFLILIAAMGLTTAIASAQTTASPGCEANASLTVAAPTTITDEFFMDEVLNISISGPGDFTVTVAGNVLLTLANEPSSTVYTVEADGVVDIVVEVDAGSQESMVTIECTPADEVGDGEGDADSRTLCHYPPGNPDAAHTITVGSQNAVDTHIEKHGDTLGGCGELDTRVDLPTANMTVFIIFNTNTIQVYAICAEECDEVGAIVVTEVIDFSLITETTEEGTVFIIVENPEEFGFLLFEHDTISVTLYYLHPSEGDPTLGVFQINIYENGVLVDDSIELLIDLEGNIIGYAD